MGCHHRVKNQAELLDAEDSLAGWDQFWGKIDNIDSSSLHKYHKWGRYA
jgi:hypothetical protein